MFKLYDYYRSSACFRVRIALNLKNQKYELFPVHLLKAGGQQLQEPYRTLNPQALVPSFEDLTQQAFLTQSLAIIEYVDETISEFPLLPKTPVERAKVRAFAQMIACDIHPLNNLRVLKFLTNDFKISEKQKIEWYHHWLTSGFNAIEKTLKSIERQGPYCFGETPGLGDICLVPQVYNALRFEFSLEHYPVINDVYELCLKHPAFVKALPENQPTAKH